MAGALESQAGKRRAPIHEHPGPNGSDSQDEGSEIVKKKKKKPVDPALLEYVEDGIMAQSQAMTNEERTRTVEQIRAHRARQAEREETELRDAMETIMAVAEKATGLSR